MTPATRRAGILGSLVAAIACSEPTAPAAPAAPAAPIAEPVGGALGSASPRGEALVVRADVSAPASTAVSDASERILASLPSSGAAAELRRILGQLTSALSAEDRSQTRRLLPHAYRTLLDIGSSEESGLGPELSAIELALDVAWRELEASGSP